MHHKLNQPKSPPFCNITIAPHRQRKIINDQTLPEFMAPFTSQQAYNTACTTNACKSLPKYISSRSIIHAKLNVCLTAYGLVHMTFFGFCLFFSAHMKSENATHWVWERRCCHETARIHRYEKVSVLCLRVCRDAHVNFARAECAEFGGPPPRRYKQQIAARRVFICI